MTGSLASAKHDRMWHCIQEQSAWYAETAPGRVYAPLVPEVSPEEEELRARIGERIREAAAKKGLSLREVAQRAEVSRGHLWNVLGGKAAASTDLLARLAKALDVDPEVLVKRPRKPRKTGD